MIPESRDHTREDRRTLILVRHSLSELVKDVSPEKWVLSDVGRQRCTKLAEHLRKHKIQRIITSTEPKAIETGQIVADILKRPWETASDLHEHERSSIGILERSVFEYCIANLFHNPHEKVFGDETAEEARIRFEQAVLDITKKYIHETLAIVAHGTVISLLIASANPIDPYTFWRGLGLPALALVSLPEFILIDTTAEIT